VTHYQESQLLNPHDPSPKDPNYETNHEGNIPSHSLSRRTVDGIINHLPAHQQATQMLKRRSWQSFGEQITELIGRRNLDNLDVVSTDVLPKPVVFEGIMFGMGGSCDQVRDLLM
jgi:hypothetical protein